MISNDALSVLLLHHHLNGLGKKNLRLIQEIMRASETAVEKYKKVCKDFPNIVILTKSATPGKVQLTFDHTTVGNKSLGKYVVAFALAGDLSSTYVVSIKMDIDFATDGNNIRLLIKEVLLRSATGDLARSKKQQDQTPHNAVLLPPLLTEVAIRHGMSDEGELLKTFARSITEWAKKGEPSTGEDDDNKKYSKGGVVAEDEKTTKKSKTKQATAKTLTSIANNCDNVLAFFQAFIVKSPQVITDPLSLQADKCARVWFYHWTDINLPNLPKPAPQYHMGLTGVLTDVMTRLHMAEALRPIVAAQHEAETKRRPPPTITHGGRNPPRDVRRG